MTARSPRPLHRAIALLTVACALSLTGTASAHAQTWTHTDPVRDVTAFGIENEEDGPTPAPEQERGDVRRVRVSHHDRRLVVRFSMRKALAGDHVLSYAIRTPRGGFILDRGKVPGAKATVGLHKQPSGKRIRCSGMRWDIDRERATVAVSIPRWCIGRPRWVRVGVVVVSGMGSDYMYVDDAMSSGGELYRLSPRVYRG